jgi:hypothetical protein
VRSALLLQGFTSECAPNARQLVKFQRGPAREWFVRVRGVVVQPRGTRAAAAVHDLVAQDRGRSEAQHHRSSSTADAGGHRRSGLAGAATHRGRCAPRRIPIEFP